jgi:methionine-rich copper-binding protein CopC/putative copper export protein
MLVQNTFRTRILAIAATLLAVILTPALLFAHAHIVRSTPAADATLDAAPQALQLWFSERPELEFTSLQLLDSAGVPMALGPVTALPGNTSGVSAAISGALANGKYSVVWHTAADDGHATSGRFFFVLTATQTPPTAGAAPLVTPPPGAQIEIHRSVKANPVVDPSANVSMSTGVRWTELVALLTLVGAVIFRLFILHDAALPAAITAESADRTRRLALGALLLFFFATFTRVVAESNLIPAVVNGRVAAVLTVVRETNWGHAWVIGLIGALLILAGLVAGRGALVGWIIAGVGVAAIATSEALTGHAGASQQRLALAVAVDVAHLLGAGGWIGGLTVLMFAGVPALRGLSDDEGPKAGSSLIRAYHHATVDSVTVVVITALFAAWMRLGTISALWTSTYGRILMIKIALVLMLLGFGWFHWRMAVTPEWDADTKFRFQRSAMIELLVGAIVVAVTAVLISTSLPMH